MPLYVRCGLPYVCQQGVCAGYGFESVAVVVEIVVDDRRVGPLMLGDVREQSRTAEQVDKGTGIPECCRTEMKSRANMRFCPMKGSGAERYGFFIEM